MSTIPISKQVVMDVFIFLLLCLPVLFMLGMGEPVVSGFWCRDQSVRYPYKPDSVPQSILVVLSFGAPFLIMMLTESIRAATKNRQRKRPCWEMLSLAKAYGIFLFGIAANCLVTDSLKYSIGRPRPHFIDLCKPDFDKINCTVEGVDIDRFVTDYECTNTNVNHKLLKDSRLSFPSGHASLSVYSTVFTVCYLQLRMHVSFSHLLRPTIQLGLLVLAILCCVTRVSDHKHFPSDVVAGALVGLPVAVLVFYKVAYKVIPTTEPESEPKRPKPHHPRTTSVDSEPQTPTPLLRPEHLLLSHSNHNFRNSSSASMSKTDFVNNV